MSKRAFVVVDLQNDYLADGRFPLVRIDEAVANAADLIDAARKRGDLVVHVRHENPAGAPFFVPGSAGADIIPAIAPRDGEATITKNHPNSFRETSLQKVLESAGVEEVVLVGAMSHMCIDATARASCDLGYGTTIIEDACATRDLEFKGEVVPAEKVHAAYMSALAFAYGTVTSTNEFLGRTA